ncbi:MAG: hypothetical protein QGG54_15540 [Gammaproteobacteria bacterium]|jgi:hypothetical protein|nr:hypothetical protein [Gammaproteobacteria bacterium]
MSPTKRLRRLNSAAIEAINAAPHLARLQPKMVGYRLYLVEFCYHTMRYIEREYEIVCDGEGYRVKELDGSFDTYYADIAACVAGIMELIRIKNKHSWPWP